MTQAPLITSEKEAPLNQQEDPGIFQILLYEPTGVFKGYRLRGSKLRN